jgi:parallel beta-helix repeat protein
VLCQPSPLESTSPRFERCVFAENKTGVWIWEGENRPTFVDCGFYGNSYGMEVWGWCSAVIDHCTFSENDRGVRVHGDLASLTAAGCLFSRNRTGLTGSNRTGLIELTDCQFLNNEQGARFSEACVKMFGCTFSGNEDFGLGSSWGSAHLTECTFSDNAGGGFVTDETSNTLTRCTFLNNRGERGGAIRIQLMWISEAAMSIDDCNFIDNSAVEGGAVCFGAWYSPLDCPANVHIRRCTFDRNFAVQGGALSCRGASVGPDSAAVSLEGCTLYGNTADEGAGIFCEGRVSVDLTNTIIAGGGNGEALFCVDVRPTPVLACCDLYGNAGGDWVGCIEDQGAKDGNLCVDPLFCDAEHGGFGLSTHSPCLPANNTCGELIGAYGEACKKSKQTQANTSPRVDQAVLSVLPNPFNPATRVRYSLSTAGLAQLSIYDVSGRIVETLVDAVQPAGEHVVEWNADAFPSGIYFCRLEAAGVTQTRKLVLLK